LHSSWTMSVSIRVRMGGSVETDFSFSRSEPKRLVVQVAKKGRRASSRVCIVAFAEASRKDAIFDDSMYFALDIGVVRILLTANTWAFTYHLSASSVGTGSHSRAAISEQMCGRIDAGDAEARQNVSSFRSPRTLRWHGFAVGRQAQVVWTSSVAGDASQDHVQ
jgi:hypothetical protein